MTTKPLTTPIEDCDDVLQEFRDKLLDCVRWANDRGETVESLAGVMIATATHLVSPELYGVLRLIGWHEKSLRSMDQME